MTALRRFFTERPPGYMLAWFVLWACLLSLIGLVVAVVIIVIQYGH